MNIDLISERQGRAEFLDLPRFAPFSLPFLDHILGNKEGKRENIHKKLSDLLPRFLQKRDVLSLPSEPKIKNLSENIQHILAEKTGKPVPAVNRSTMNEWRSRGIIRSQAREKLDLDSIAAILIAAQLDPRQQGFLPSFIDSNEPYWWCYGYLPGSTQARIYPYPLPNQLPNETFLFTPWQTYYEGWRLIPHIGAIRFANLPSLKELSVWDPSLDSNLGLFTTGWAKDEALAHYRELILLKLLSTLILH